ncbi:MAG: DUF559 domain-containing protein [Propioniciclava sp.]
MSAAPTPGFTWQQRRLDAELLISRGSLLLASPALTVLDLIPQLGGGAIDEALRRRAASLSELWRALKLTPGRTQNPLRRTLLEDSRDEPWSEAERALHQILRVVSLPCTWQTNAKIVLDGRRYYLDVALRDLMLNIEVDGWQFHRSRQSFESDRQRDAALIAAGWLVVRLSAANVLTDPGATGVRLGQIASTRAQMLGL